MSASSAIAQPSRAADVHICELCKSPYKLALEYKFSLRRSRCLRAGSFAAAVDAGLALALTLASAVLAVVAVMFLATGQSSPSWPAQAAFGSVLADLWIYLFVAAISAGLGARAVRRHVRAWRVHNSSVRIRRRGHGAGAGVVFSDDGFCFTFFS